MMLIKANCTAIVLCIQVSVDNENIKKRQHYNSALCHRPTIYMSIKFLFLKCINENG